MNNSKQRFNLIHSRPSATRLLTWLLLLLAGQFMGRAQTCAPLPCSAVSWWAAEAAASDSLGINPGIMIGGGNFVPGVMGYAFDLDGATQYVEISDSPSLNPVGSFSIEGWIFPRQDREQGILEKWADSNDYPAQRSYNFSTLPGLALRFAISDTANQRNPGFHQFDSPGKVLTLNAWNHVAAVFDQVAGTRRIYVNGVEVAVRTGDFVTVTASRVPVAIGVAENSLLDRRIFFDGRIDELAFYSDALAAPQIQAIYVAGATGKCLAPSALPVLFTQPQSATVTAGNDIALTVLAGCEPVYYQWRREGTNQPGATAASLNLVGVRSADAGRYSVVVTNSFGSVTSVVASLTVVPATCVTPLAGEVARWTGEDSLTDAIGGLTGAPQGGLSFGSGKVGHSLVFDGISGSLVVPDAPALRFDPSIGMTVELWAYRTGLQTTMHLLGKRNAGCGTYQYILSMDQTNGLAFFGGSGGVTSRVQLPRNQWIHVAGTYDGAIFCIYTNGVLLASAGGNLGPPDGAPLTLGGDGDCPTFAGALDEVSFYNRALSAAEIQNVFTAGVAGKCGADLPPTVVRPPASQAVVAGQNAIFGVVSGGSAPTGYQWLFEGNLVPGATNAQLVITNVQLPNAGGYSAWLSNAFGQMTSTVANLSVITFPPMISVGAGDHKVSLGNDLTLRVVAAGTLPLNYQWQFNGAVMPGATGAVLVLTNLQAGDSGGYTVVITNVAGAITSAPALITVSAPVCVTPPPDLVGWWPGEGNADDLAKGNGGILQGTVGFGSGRVRQAFSFDGSGGVVVVPGAADLNFAAHDPLTIEFWAKQTVSLAGATVGPHLIGKRYPGCAEFNYQIAVNLATGLGFYGGAGAATTGWFLPLNTWVHLAATFDGAVLQLYTNGVLAATGWGNLGNTNAAPLVIGGSGDCPGFTGLMDEVGIYRRTLSGGEIKAIYDAGTAGKCAGADGPTILADPGNQTVTPGSTVSFTVTTSGALPLTYQWRFNATDLPGATQPRLTLTNLLPVNAGGYSVLVTNSWGAATSREGTLTLIGAAPMLTFVATNLTVLEGRDIQITINVRGTLPLAYQWFHGNDPVPGANAATLWLTNCRAAATGWYSVTVSNPAGSTTSGNALLTVTPAICVTPPLGLVAWWPAEGNAGDRAGTNAGALHGGVTFAPGRVGQGFQFDGSNAFVELPLSSALDFAGSEPLTIEGWAYPTRTATTMHLLGNRSADCGYFSYQLATDPVNGLSFSGGNGGISTGHPLPGETWTHIAATFDGAMFRLYTNGVFAAQGAGDLGLPSAAPLRLGTAGDCPGFSGLLDEISIYNRALTPGEIAGLYQSSVAGKCGQGLPPQLATQPRGMTVISGQDISFGVTTSGSSPVTGQWWQDTAPIAGATNLALTLTNVLATNAGNYRIVLSNVFGNATSDVAMVQVITTPPTLDYVLPFPELFPGDTVTFLVAARGSAPLSYQWTHNRVVIPGATRPSLTLPNLQGSDAGDYVMTVTNVGGVAMTPSLPLVITQPKCSVPPAGLVAWWPGEMNAQDYARGNQGTAVGNVGFAPGYVGSAFSFDGTGAVISVPDAPVLNFGGTNGMTLELWACRTGSHNPMHLVGKRNPDCGAVEYQLAFDGGLRFDGGGGQLVTSCDLPLNVWTHLAATCDGNTFQLYTNGTLLAQGPGNLGLGNSAPLVIGGSAKCPAFTGLLDEVSLYNRALSGGEIRAIYEARAFGKCPDRLPPLVLHQPQDLVLLAGQSGRFQVVAGGWPPLGYQWQHTGTNLAGETMASLSLVNLSPADAGNYSVIVSNASGTVVSSNALLTVLTLEGNCLPVPAGLAAWWPGDGDALERVGVSLGNLVGGVSFVTGFDGPAFAFDGIDGSLQVPDSPSLRFDGSNGMTVELWAYRTGTQSTMHLLGKRAGCGSQMEYQLAMDPANGLAFYGGGSGGVTTGIQLPLTTWMHLAATVEGNSFLFYTNGVLAATGQGTLATGTAPFTLGTSGGCPYYAGWLDEVTLYHRALSAAEIQLIYSVGAGGKCKVPIPPQIAKLSPSAVELAGAYHLFEVGVAGAQPFSFQWLREGIPIAGATLAALSLTNLQASDSGNYSVVITNSAGAVTSSNISLTVIGIAPGCITPPAGLAGWWPGDGDAFDRVNRGAGMLLGGVGYGFGRIGSAFVFDGISGRVEIPDSPALRFDESNGMTVELWVYRTGSQGTMHLLGKRKNDCGSFEFQLATDPANGLGFYCGGGGGVTTGIQLPIGAWMHLAVTDQGGDLQFYTNGFLAATGRGTLGVGAATPLTLGTSGGCPYFAGLLDEVALYHRALTPAEILGLWAAGTTGKCKESLPPQFVSQPQSMGLFYGETGSFIATVSGTPPYNCQWSRNGTAISGATNLTLMLTNVQAIDVGNYSLMVSNVSGSIVSSNAVLGVTPSACYPAPTGLVGWWRGEGDVVDATGNFPGMINGGVSFGSGRAGQAFSFDGSGGLVSITPGNPNVWPGAAGFTVELWAYRTGQQTSMLLLGEAVPNCGGFIYLLAMDPVYGLGFYGNGGGVAVGAYGSGASSGATLPLKTWIHLAATADGTTIRLYTNGVLAASGPGSIIRALDLPMTIGDAGGCAPFTGLLDEVSVYSRALSANEIQGIYHAGGYGKCGTAPQQFIQKLSITARVGQNLFLLAHFTGSRPLTYQWFHNGMIIAGATNQNYLVSNTQPSDGGVYSVAVANWVGATTNAVSQVRVPTVTVSNGTQVLTNGNYTLAGPIFIQLQNAYPTGDIFYTLDGSQPDLGSRQYFGPIRVDHSVTIRAIGFNADFSQVGDSDTVVITVLPGYTLQTSTAGGGTVTVNPAASGYAANAVVEVTAVPAPGWNFLQWLGDVAGSNSAVNLVMDHNATVQAVFGTTLNLVANGAGRVAAEPPATLYPYGANLRLEALPQSGNYFAVWGNVPGGSVNPLSYLVTNAQPTISALFQTLKTNEAALTVLPVGHGQVGMQPRANAFNLGQTITLSAQPDPGQSFLGWSGDASGSANPLTLTLAGSRTIYANFTRASSLMIYPAQAPGGAIFPWVWLTGDLGFGYRLDGSFNLVDWVPLATLTNTLGTLQFADPAASNLPGRFYRGVRLP